MKFIIEENEANRILSMHQALKEQVNPPAAGTPAPPKPKTTQEKLQEFVDGGCVKNGVVVRMNSKNPNKQFAIKQESTKNPGKFRYFFVDFTYGTVGADGTFQTATNKWECNQTNIAANQSQAAQAQANQAQAQQTAQTNIDLTQKEGGWKKREDITDTDANVNNPQMYQKQVVNGVTLYRRISGAGIAGALDERQQKVVEKWKAEGAKLEGEVDAEQAKTWTRKLVSPKSEGLFSEDFYMYFPPNTVNNADITAAFKDAVTDQTPQSKADCKTAVEAYYMAFKTKKKIEPNTLNAMKEKVQACSNQFEGQWGGVFSKVDDYVNILRGVKPGGPSSYGDDAQWRLK